MRRGRVNRRNKNMMSRHKSNIGRVNRSNKKSGVNKRKNKPNNRMNNKPQTPKTTPRNKRKHPPPLFLQQTEKGTRTSQ